MGATIRQIAEQCGLSLSTVSHVLGTRSEKFRPETRKRVLDAARELGYRPNSSARAIRSGRFGCMALLKSAEKGGRSYLPELLLDGVSDELTDHHLHLVLAKLPDERLTSEGYVPKILSELLADGLLVNYQFDFPRKLLDLIDRHRLPSIWINVRHETDSVRPEDIDAARQATAYLLGLGHRRVAYVNYFGQDRERAHYSMKDRFQGYSAAMRQAGLKPRNLAVARKASSDERLANASAWLSEPDRPTAVVAYAGRTLGPILLAAAARGIRVPQDLSLITFGDDIQNLLGVPVSHMAIPWYQIGRVAVDMLREKVRDPARVLPTRVLAQRLEEGATCAPPVAGAIHRNP